MKVAENPPGSEPGGENGISSPRKRRNIDQLDSAGVSEAVDQELVDDVETSESNDGDTSSAEEDTEPVTPLPPIQLPDRSTRGRRLRQV
jgi:hypothetical protein